MFRTNLKDLAINLAFIKRAATVGKRYNNPVLSLLRVDVVDGVASIGFYDWETAVTVRMNVSGDDCSFAIQLDEVVNAVRSIGSKDDAEFEVSDSGLSITADGMSVTATLAEPAAVTDMPSMPVVEGGPALIASGPEFSDAVNAVSSAIGDDTTLPMLTGIKLESDGVRIDAATTDRFKMANAHIPSASVPTAFGLLLPGRPVLAFGKRVAKETAVSVAIGKDGAVAVESDTVTMVMRELDCEFPKWRALFPKADDAKVSFECDGQTLAKRVKALHSAKALHVDLDIHEGAITVSCRDRNDNVGSKFVLDAGDLQVTEPMVARFTVEYLAQILATVPRGTKVRFSLISPTRPLLMQWNEHRALLMPVRIPA